MYLKLILFISMSIFTITLYPLKGKACENYYMSSDSLDAEYGEDTVIIIETATPGLITFYETDTRFNNATIMANDSIYCSIETIFELGSNQPLTMSVTKIMDGRSYSGQLRLISTNVTSQKCIVPIPDCCTLIQATKPHTNKKGYYRRNDG